MSTAVLVPRRGPGPRSEPRPRLLARLADTEHWPVGWPLVALFAGYPLWWILGVGEFACVLVAVPLGLYLLARHRQVIAPRGIGAWLLFVIWYVGGVLVLRIHAPGGVSGGSSTRYLTFAFRFSWYLAATIVLLFVVTTRRQLSDGRLARYVSYMFVVVAAGGVLGMVAPGLSIHSVLELVLPHGVAHNTFVYNLIHPVAAQVQTFLGYDEGRPSAPFSYTNTWGLNFGCTLPFFLISWFGKDAGRRRYVAPFILFGGLLAMVYSLNRGLWLSLIASALLVSLRYAAVGKVRILLLLLASIGVLAAVVLLSPLRELIAERLAHPHSNEGRANLGELTFQGTLQGSPLVGFGSTRPVLGNFTSIAGGATAQCPGCSPPAMGTQGQLWLVMFSQGFVGLALYLWFLIRQLVGSLPSMSKYVVAGGCAILVHLVTLPVYNLGGPALIIVMISIGLMWRARERSRLARSSVAHGQSGHAQERTLGVLARVVRRHTAAIVVLAFLGAVVGAGYAIVRPPPSVATQALLLPQEQTGGASGGPPPTIDTDAQLLHSHQVLVSVSRALGGVDPQLVADRLSVTAVTNTRVLQVSYTSAKVSTAVTGAHAAAKALLTKLSTRDEDLRQAYIKALQQRAASLADEIAAARQGLPRGSERPLDPLQREVSSLQGRLNNVTQQELAARYQGVPTGSLLRDTTVHRSRDLLVSSVTAGLMIGLVLGLVLAWLLDGRFVRLRTRTVPQTTGAPMLARVRAGWGQRAERGLMRVRADLDRYPQFVDVLAVGDAPGLDAVRRSLAPEGAHPIPGHPPAVAVVARSRAPARPVRDLVRRLDAAGIDVVGVILVAGRAPW